MGLGAHMISLKPRTSTEWKEQTFKVNERMTAFSYEAHLKYSGRNYTFAAKTLMASALDHTALLGGYGVSSVDSRTGEQGYTPFSPFYDMGEFRLRNENGDREFSSDIRRIWEPGSPWSQRIRCMVWDWISIN